MSVTVPMEFFFLIKELSLTFLYFTFFYLELLRNDRQLSQLITLVESTTTEIGSTLEKETTEQTSSTKTGTKTLGQIFLIQSIFTISQAQALQQSLWMTQHILNQL